MKHPGLNSSDGDSEDETLYEQFDLGGMTLEEVRAYNMIAPAGQRLQDVFSDNEDPIRGFDGPDDYGFTTPSSKGNWMSSRSDKRKQNPLEIEKERSKTARKKAKKLRRRASKELRLDGRLAAARVSPSGQRTTTPPVIDDIQYADKPSNALDPKTEEEGDQNFLRSSERDSRMPEWPGQNDEQCRKTQEQTARIDAQIRGIRNFSNAKQVEIYEHGGMKGIDKEMKNDLEMMKDERDQMEAADDQVKRKSKSKSERRKNKKKRKHSGSGEAEDLMEDVQAAQQDKENSEKRISNDTDHDHKMQRSGNDHLPKRRKNNVANSKLLPMKIVTVNETNDPKGRPMMQKA
ncbi:MAG: hypothetical protein Q9164_007388 [Protoblastenia rupestris]